VKWSRGLIFIALLLISGNGYAQDCNVSVVSVNFGNYDALASSDINATGNVTVACSTGISFTIKMDPGQNSGGSFDQRRMLSPGTGSTLRYNLFRDSSLVEVWGDGTGNTFTQAGIGTGANQEYTVYGRIPALQNVKPGTFQDSVTVILEW